MIRVLFILLLFVVPALAQAASPYPPSTYSASLDSATRCAVSNSVHPGDQWPTTWQTDGKTYAWWGDGTGITGSTNVYFGAEQLSGTPPIPCSNLTTVDVFLGNLHSDTSPGANKKLPVIQSDGGTILRSFIGGSGAFALSSVSSTNNGTAWGAFDTDNFNRANEGPPATGWVTARNGGHKIVSNQLVNVDGSQDESAWNTTMNADQMAWIGVVSLPGDGTSIMVGARTDSAGHGYYVACNQVSGSNNDTIDIRYRDVATGTNIIQTFNLNTDWVAGFHCGIHVVGDTIYTVAYNNGTYLFNTAAGGGHFTGTGTCAIDNTPGATVVIDNFNCFNVTGTGSIVTTLADSVTLDQSAVQFGAGYTGLPSFLESTKFYYNFIKAGARTDIEPTAGSTDAYLCRVPRSTWNDKSTYQCVTAIDVISNNPTWGAMASKISVFHDATGYIAYWHMSYNPGIGRFIAAEVSGINQNIVGLFDAPTPWGPWTTLYYSATFIDGSRVVMPHVPTQYTSSDGLTMYLVYSGGNYYNLNVIKMTLGSSSTANALLSWNAGNPSDNITSYGVYRLLGTCGAPGSVALLATTGVVTSYSDFTIPVNALGASYELTASNSFGTSDHSVRVCKVFDALPSTVTGVTATPQGSTSITVAWTAAGDDKGISNYLFEASPAGCTTWTQFYSGSATTFQDVGLAAGTTRCYRGRAVDTAGQLSAQYSTVVQATTVGLVLPTVTSAVTSATGATLIGTQDSGNPATAIRVEYGDAVNAYANNNIPIAQFPGWPTSATYTFTWPSGTTWACFHARDAAGNEDPVNYRCNSVTPASDTTPPARSNGQPTGTLNSGTTSVTLALDTNENATCKHGTVAGTAYASIANTFTTTGGLHHSATVSGLSDGNTYNRYVRCQDGAANTNTDDFTITWTISAAPPPPADTTPPVLSNGAPTGTLPSNTTSTILSLTTNESATCKFGTTAGVAYASIPTTFTTTGNLNHAQTIPVASGVTYTYYVRCQDVAANATTTDYPITFSVATPPPPPADTTPPVLSNGQPIGVLPLGTTSTTLRVTTDEPATCKYGTVANTTYSSIASAMVDVGTTHSASITGLTDGASRTYYLRCQDTSSNLNQNTVDYVIGFTVAIDSIPPLQITNLVVTPITSTSISLTWALGQDNVGIRNYVVQRSPSGCASFATIASPQLNGLTDLGLSGGTTYCYKVQGVDTSGNAGTFSAVVNGTTFASADTTPPAKVTGLTGVFRTVPTRIDLTFNQPTDDRQVAGTVISRCTVGTTCPTYTVLGSTTTTAYSDQTVQVATEYHYIASAVDTAGNQGTASDLFDITTPSVDATPPSDVTGCSAQVLSLTQITVSCSPATDNVAVATYLVESCDGSACTNFALRATSLTPTFADGSLSADTTRRYRWKATDAAGNVSVNYSSVVEATTPLPPTGQKLGICPCKKF